MEGVDWGYFNKDLFNELDREYLPMTGEGSNMATQTIVAVNKLVYRWYNDGDVYDNTYHLKGWCNNLSTYANWLYNHTLGYDNVRKVTDILNRIIHIQTNEEYEWLLKDLCDTLLTKEYMAEAEKHPSIGSVYDEEGPFEFIENDDEDEEDDLW